MTHTPSKKITTLTHHPDCVTVVCMGNTVLAVSGYFKQGTAANTMAKVLKAKATGQLGQSA